jgi:hypothetical protein
MNCLDGLYCEAVGSLSKCAQRKPNGEQCGDLLKCQSMNCDVATSRCIPATLETAYCLGY